MPGVNSRGQLVFPFEVKPAHGRRDFLIAPCNEPAFRFIQRWPDWPSRAAALYGPSGCGKSHLTAVWREAAGAQVIDARELSQESLSAHGPDAALVIEDLDQEPPSETRDHALLALFERPKASLLVTARTPPVAWQSRIGDLTSRFHALIGFAMWQPDDVLLAGLIAKHFTDRQLDVPDVVTSRIVNQVERTPAAIAAFIARLDHRAFSQKRAVTERLVLELLESEAYMHNSD
jgi:chromosomal replication initiation ATPase DnaA